jgi:hypothetical protein
MVIRLVIDFGELVKVALKGRVEKGVGEWGKVMGATGFCDPCVYLEVFLFQWRVLVSGIAGGWNCLQLVQ